MIGNNFGIWVAAGLIPYWINKRETRNGWILQMRALFWSLEVHSQPPRRNRWTLRILLIERIHNAVWVVIMRMREDDFPPG